MIISQRFLVIIELILPFLSAIFLCLKSIRFNYVINLNIFIIFKNNSAIITSLYRFNIILKSFKRCNTCFKDHFITSINSYF